MMNSNTIDLLYKVNTYIDTYVRECNEIRYQFGETNPLVNHYWLFRSEEESRHRLKQIERVLRYFLRKHKELTSELQIEAQNKVFNN